MSLTESHTHQGFGDSCSGTAKKEISEALLMTMRSTSREKGTVVGHQLGYLIISPPLTSHLFVNVADRTCRLPYLHSSIK